jgi:Fe2+ or Zn2+ uptake regulation protein
MSVILKEALDWKLIYSMDQHGISLHTMYRNCSLLTESTCIVALKDDKGEIYGAFLRYNQSKLSELPKIISKCN